MTQIGGKGDHFTRYGSTQWDLCTLETYQELIDKFRIDKMIGFRPYEDLRLEYEDLRFTHNLDPHHNNVWYSEFSNSGLWHPTQKPLDIIERLIKCHSNKGDIILDCFLGSGTTAVASKRLFRKYIGFELSENYLKIAQSRLNELEYYQLNLFEEED